MKPQHRCEDFILRDVLIKMLGILRLISQDLEKIRDRKSLHIKHAYGFDDVVHDDGCVRKSVRLMADQIPPPTIKLSATVLLLDLRSSKTDQRRR